MESELLGSNMKEITKRIGKCSHSPAIPTPWCRSLWSSFFLSFLSSGVRVGLVCGSCDLLTLRQKTKSLPLFVYTSSSWMCLCFLPLSGCLPPPHTNKGGGWWLIFSPCSLPFLSCSPFSAEGLDSLFSFFFFLLVGFSKTHTHTHTHRHRHWQNMHFYWHVHHTHTHTSLSLSLSLSFSSTYK